MLSAREMLLKDKGQVEPADENDNNRIFVNKGLLIWKKQRLHWNGDRIKEKKKRFAQNIDIEEILDHILSNSWQQRPPSPTSRSTSGSSKENTKQRMRSSLSDPVPLRQIVDVLVDLWEAEGHDM